ncbi:oligosaccharyl transferase subunit beta [Aureobasidium subglaciale]|nr:oligosaccharyl transferase subunit beta [Aureobasidium subglaciale]
MKSFLSLLLLGLVSLVQALSSTGNRLLVVLEESSDKSKYSSFFGDLESRGYSVTYDSPKSKSLSLFKHGNLAYDHLVLLPPKSKGFGPQLTPNILVDYVNNNGNVLLALTADQPIPAAVASLLLELDVTLPPERSALVVDHINYDTKSAADKHDVLLIPAPKNLKAGVKNYFGVDGILAVPRAVGQLLGNASPLLSPILRAPETAYSYNPKEEDALEDVFASGAQLSLVSAFQARNSARFTILGSAEMLQDTWFKAQVKAPRAPEITSTANKAFAEKLSAWTFQEIGVLKVGKVQHYLNEGKVKDSTNLSVSEFPEINPVMYRIKNDVHYSIELSEYDGDRLVPFVPSSEDSLQLEFSMLSPFHRVTLKPTSKTATSTIFSTTFTVPDQHGIFNFIVNYKRPFLSSVYEKRTVTVRHFAHDEWPRSFVISGAYPWIAGIGVTATGWLIFVAVWLYSKPDESKAKKTQ